MGLSFHTKGLRSKPALLLLHGFLGSSDDWRFLVEYLEQSFYLILIDLPGHGESVSVSAMNNEQGALSFIHKPIDKILEHLDIQRLSVLGYSLGGRIAMSYALAFPDKIQYLIIESGHFGLACAAEKKARQQSDQYWAERFNSEPLADVLQDWYSQPVFAELSSSSRQLLIAERQRYSGKMLGDVLLAFSLAHQPDYTKAFALASFSILFICGENDQKFTAIGKRLEHEGIVDQCRIIAGAGHNVHRVQAKSMAITIESYYDVERVNYERSN